MVEPFHGSTTLTSHYSHSTDSETYPPGTARTASGQRHAPDSPRYGYSALSAAELAGEDPDYLRSGIPAGPMPSKTPAIPSFHPSSSSSSQTPPQTISAGKFDTLSHPSTPRQSQHPTGSAGALRVVNHGDNDRPELPPGAGYDDNPRHSFNARRGSAGYAHGGSGGDGGAPGFRRHADAGRVQQDVVDLPPLYTDVPRDDDSPGETPR